MSQKKVKQVKRLVKKYKKEQLKAFLDNVKACKFPLRVKYAWYILKGKRKR